MRPGSPDRAWYRSSRRASRRPQPGWDTIAAFAQNSTLIEPMTTRLASGLRQARCRPARRTCPRTGQRGTTHPRRPSRSNKARLTALGAGNLVKRPDGHRRLASSCSSIGSSGRVVPERPGDDLSTQSASGGPSLSAAPGLLVSMRRNSATASFNGTAKLSTYQQSTPASRSISCSPEIVLAPSAKGTTGQCVRSAT